MTKEERLKNKDDINKTSTNFKKSKSNLDSIYLGLEKQDKMIEEYLTHLSGEELAQAKEFQKDFLQIKELKKKDGDVDNLLKSFQQKWLPLAEK